ncbi:quinolinate synthase NadA [candidate division KSB1 bacterium]|nr:quinolinate synthase NadA [candidate division KSB1 bacterium]
MPIEEKTVAATFAKMSEKLRDIVPAEELRYKAELAFEINQLKREKNAVILGHNYMEPALYCSVPDYVGDSLELSRQAATTDKDVIVFCGVRFMGETAKILCPDKTVLVPSPKAGCSLAESITAAEVRKLKKQYPGVPVVTYVNTYADVKAESDICCTSGNASAVVESLNTDTVLFIPDEYMAGNIARETGMNVIFPIRNPRDLQKRQADLACTIIGWKGRCEVHEQFTLQDINKIRKQFPDAVILAHPECRPEVVAASDFSGSTSGMIRYVRDHAASRYLLLTECSMADNIAAENRDIRMLRSLCIRCPHMQEITLEMTRDALLRNQFQIEVPEPIRVRAKRAVDRMLEIRGEGGAA